MCVAAFGSPPALAAANHALERLAQTSASPGRAAGRRSAGARGGPSLTLQRALSCPEGAAAPQDPQLRPGEHGPACSHPRRRWAACLASSFLFLNAGHPGARKVTSRCGLVVTPSDRGCRASLHAPIGSGPSVEASARPRPPCAPRQPPPGRRLAESPSCVRPLSSLLDGIFSQRKVFNPEKVRFLYFALRRPSAEGPGSTEVTERRPLLSRRGFRPRRTARCAACFAAAAAPGKRMAPH